MYSDSKMAFIKSLERIKANWKAGTAGAGARLKEGVLNPRRPWKESTLAAVDLHTTATQEALARGAFGKGVEDTPAEKQKNRASLLGPARYAQGTAAATDDYGTGFGPYREVIAGVELKPRGPKGSPENYDNVKAIGDALHARKVGA